MTDFGAALDAAAARGLYPNVEDLWRLIAPPQDFYVEFQALKAAGKNYYAHAANLATSFDVLSGWEALPVEQQPVGLHPILNSVSQTVAHRDPSCPPGQWHQSIPGKSTTDKDIGIRIGLYIDLDSVRDTDTSSTAEELAASRGVTERAYLDLGVHVGYEALAVGHSGNGCAIFIALDYLPETPELRQLITRVLHAIKAIYETDRVKIDAHLSDPKRLVPAFGTIKRKGPANDPLRPHRRTGIIVPPVVRRLGFVELQNLAAALEARLPPKPALPPRPAPTPLVDEDDFDAEPSADGELDFKALRKCLVEARRKKGGTNAEHHQMLTALIEGTALAVSGTYTGQTDLPRGRSIAINRAASLLASWLPLGTPWETAVEVLRPAVEATDCEPEGIEHWLGVARTSYGRALDRAFVRARERKEKEAVEESFRRALFNAPRPTGPQPTALVDAPPQSVAPQQPAIEPSPPPTPSPDGDLPLLRNADGNPIQCTANAYVCLTLAPETRNCIRWNEVSRDIEVTGGVFAGVKSSVLATEIMNWLQAVHRLYKVKRHEVEDQLLLVATRNSYDPIKDYLNSVVWDGVSRLERFFFEYIKARTVNEEGVDITEHLKRIGRKFFIGGAARPLYPGCQLDTMLVLEGLEGKGKTSAFRILFGDYYAGMKLDPTNKDTLLTGSNNWGLEFEELAALTRAADETLKAFITTIEDKFRPPYGRRIERAPRRCVLVGTTNEDQWLTWGKGLRRYWPVYVEAVDLEALRRDRDQLWAEAVARLRGYTDVKGDYHAPEPWHLTAEEWEEARQEAATRISEPYLEAKIREWYFRGPGSRRKFFTVVDIIETCLALQPSQASEKLESDIRRTLRRVGFVPKRSSDDIRGWVPTEETLAKVAAAQPVAPTVPSAFTGLK